MIFIKIYWLNVCNYSGVWYAVIEWWEKKRLNLMPSLPSTLISQKFRLSLQHQHIMMILKRTKIFLSFWQCINWNWKIFCGEFEHTLNSDLSLKHSFELLIILLLFLYTWLVYFHLSSFGSQFLKILSLLSSFTFGKINFPASFLYTYFNPLYMI